MEVGALHWGHAACRVSDGCSPQIVFRAVTIVRRRARGWRMFVRLGVQPAGSAAEVSPRQLRTCCGKTPPARRSRLSSQAQQSGLEALGSSATPLSSIATALGTPWNTANHGALGDDQRVLMERPSLRDNMTRGRRRRTR